MAATPEAKVKAKVHARLKQAGAYAVNYIGGAYANNGTPDILACCHGRFIGIECKAGRGKPTQLQLRNLEKIEAAGGLAFIINEKNLEVLDGLEQNTARSNWRDFDRPITDPCAE
ncbi:MAG: VRR-NUC domain-containing protein [Verrucomicrobiaceae bacterium]|nr:MAG: VRR-NUC domain-containing protein [Verrucomicrobiaceae bacterium]RPJ30551.1 MAG: VRR-NUC domain-containing protein [Verrucomicrobiaceae bacterium]RPJ33430.1 MAG: VRR-NUC domain-containing protein [Verrucomicrobiaceae bacterium]